MCMIICKPIGIGMPGDETLAYCESRNRDGIGIAYTQGGSVRIKKDFQDLGQFRAWCASQGLSGESQQAKATGVLVHMRSASVGAVIGRAGQINRHPYPVSRKLKRLKAPECQTDLAVAHNGTLDEFRGTHKKYSDTLQFVQSILADPVIKGNLHTEAIQELITGYLDGSRLAFMDRAGHILRFGIFHAQEGLYYSNMNYKPYQPPVYTPLSRSCFTCRRWYADDRLVMIEEYVYKCIECYELEKSLKQGPKLLT